MRGRRGLAFSIKVRVYAVQSVRSSFCIDMRTRGEHNPSFLFRCVAKEMDGKEPSPAVPSPNDTPEPIPVDNPQLLTQLHIAEYQALTTRATYFITIMAGMFPLFILYLAVVSQLIKPANGAFTDAFIRLLTVPTGVRAAFVWGNFFIFQVIVTALEHLLLEQYGIVLYLESRVRPLLQQLVGKGEFWNYEAFQTQAKRTSRFGEVANPIVVCVSLLAVIWKLPNFLRSDYVGMTANLFLLAWLIFVTVEVVRTRHEWERIVQRPSVP